VWTFHDNAGRKAMMRCADGVRTILRCAVAAAVSSLPAQTQAHHSTALVYHRDGPIIEAEGVITRVAWVNPHVKFTMRGTGADGVERDWEIETNSVSTVSRFGLTAELVAVGNEVKVAGNGGRVADNVLWLTNMMLPNGREVLFGSAVRSRWSGETIGSDIRGAVTPDTQGLGIFRIWTNATNPVAFWGGDLPLTASAAAARAAFNAQTDEPTANCVPKGMPFIMEQPYPMQLVRNGDDILMRMEEYDAVRRIRMTGTADDERPTLHGTSRGRWDGAALVVTTTNIDYGWFNGTGIPLGPEAKTEERFELNADGSRLEYTMLVTDAATFTAPVTLRKAWEWRPGEELRPYECRQ
jgi:hypothetical protein